MALRRFAQFAADWRAAGLPPEIYHAASRAVVDWFSATLPGSQMDAATIMRAALVEAGQPGTSRLVPDGQRVPPRAAALINATASHTAELDDIFRDGIYHPGSPTVGAVLALGEHRAASGRDVLRAIAIGYEIGDRIAAAIQPAHYTYWHTTGTVGTIGAAAAAAELLELDPERFAHALATATTMAAGLQQAFRSDAMSKPLHAGHAAEAGLLAALLAERGYTGALDVLDGEAGFGRGLSSDPDWNAAIADLGTEWGIAQATVKNYSCCGHTFAAVDAALALRAEGLDVEDIEAITVATYSTALKVAGNTDPKTAFEAKFSTAYCMAAAFVLGSVRLRAFESSALNNAALQALAAKVTLEADPDYDAAFPGQRAARVTVRMSDNSERSYERLTRKGDPEDPLTDDDLSEKFTDLSRPVLGAERTDRLQASLWRIGELDDVNDLDIGDRT